jgi:uncharacterized membrane protein
VSINDEDFDVTLARVLRIGVIISASVIATGGVVYLSRHGFESPAYHVFRGEAGRLRSPGGILGEAANLSGRGLIQLGLLILIATPIARVVFSVIGFLRAGDRLYTAITLFVLALLAYSVTSG